MRKVGDNPPVIYPETLDIVAPPADWWVLKLKPRQEKAMADDLIENAIAYYLPQYTKVVRRADNNKPRKSILPLFPGYISICGNPGFELLLYKTNRIVSILKIKYQLRFMRELLSIRRAQESGLSLEPLETTFVPGDRVEVISGTLKGVVGVVNKIKDVCKLVVAVEGLGMATMTIDSSLVRPAPETVEVDQTDQQT